MAGYKVIHKAQGAGIPWEPGCPVVITALQVSRNTETSECWLQAKVRNVSGAGAASIYATASLTYADGSSEELPVEFLDADVAASCEQNLKPRKLPRGDVQTCALAVTRVETSDETWGSTGDAKPLPTQERLTLSPRAAAQRALSLGIDLRHPAARGKIQDRGDWWVCACGQANVGRLSCCACDLPKAALAANEDETELLADADKRDDETYAEAVMLQEQGTVDSLAKAIEKFESLGDRDGCAERAAECSEGLSTLKSANRKKHTKLGAAISAGVATVIAVAIVITQVVIPAWERAAEQTHIEAERAAEQARAEAERAAKQARAEAEYQYVTEHLSNSDETTYEYLCELKELGYGDAADIFESLYEWHFELVATTEEAYEANGFVDLTEYSGSSTLSETGIAVLKCWGGHPSEVKTGFVAFTCEVPISPSQTTRTILLTSDFQFFKGGVGADDEDAYYTVALSNPDYEISVSDTGISYGPPTNKYGYLTSVVAEAYVDGFGAFNADRYGSSGSAYVSVLGNKGKITPVATSGTIVTTSNQ